MVNRCVRCFKARPSRDLGEILDTGQTIADPRSGEVLLVCAGCAYQLKSVVDFLAYFQLRVSPPQPPPIETPVSTESPVERRKKGE